jgi:hypothetical protein
MTEILLKVALNTIALTLNSFETANIIESKLYMNQGRIQDFKLGGAHFKKLRRAEGGAKIFGVFRMKNHHFTQKNHIFSNFRGERAGCAPPLDPPLI